MRKYHEFLCWTIEHNPRWLATLERRLNPVLGKSLVIYVEKVDPAMSRHRRSRSIMAGADRPCLAMIAGPR